MLQLCFHYKLINNKILQNHKHPENKLIQLEVRFSYYIIFIILESLVIVVVVFIVATKRLMPPLVQVMHMYVLRHILHTKSPFLSLYFVLFCCISKIIIINVVHTDK